MRISQSALRDRGRFAKNVQRGKPVEFQNKPRFFPGSAMVKDEAAGTMIQISRCSFGWRLIELTFNERDVQVGRSKI